MIGDEFKVWRRKPWYKRVRYYVYAVVIFASFQAGQYYNATRQMDAIGLPVIDAPVRDLGMVAPVEYRLEVGML